MFAASSKCQEQSKEFRYRIKRRTARTVKAKRTCLHGEMGFSPSEPWFMVALGIENRYPRASLSFTLFTAGDKERGDRLDILLRYRVTGFLLFSVQKPKRTPNEKE
jgi:hypothetical protein